AMQCGQRASRSDFENRTAAIGTAPRRCTVEIPVGGLDESGHRLRRVRAIRWLAKAVNRGQCALRCDLKNRAAAQGPACDGCPIEVPVGALDQPAVRAFTVGATRLSAETVKRDQRALRGDFEDCSTANAGVAVVVSAAIDGCSVEVSVDGLNQLAVAYTVTLVEAVQSGESLCGRR